MTRALNGDIVNVVLDEKKYSIIANVPSTPHDFISHHKKPASDAKVMVLDLETTGLDNKKNKIIELGFIVYNAKDHCIEKTGNYRQQIDEPLEPKAQIVNGLTDEDIKGQNIDWLEVKKHIDDVDFVICHYAIFDRQFLENAGPKELKKLFLNKKFACSKNDVHWFFRGYVKNSLENLNLKMGYRYDAHQALNDCYATLNVLLMEDGAFVEMLSNANKKQYVIMVDNVPDDKKEKISEWFYRWSDGQFEEFYRQHFPLGWWKEVEEEELSNELKKLRNEIVDQEKEPVITYFEIDASSRYSSRHYLYHEHHIVDASIVLK